MIEIDAGMPQTALRKMQMSLPRCMAAMIPAQTRHQPSKIACRMRNIMFLPRKTELRDLPDLKYASLLCRRGEIQKRACKDAPGVWGWGSLQPRAVGTRACIFEAAAWKHAPARGDWWRMLRNFLADCFTTISASDAQSLEAIGRYAGTSAGLPSFSALSLLLSFCDSSWSASLKRRPSCTRTLSPQVQWYPTNPAFSSFSWLILSRGVSFLWGLSKMRSFSNERQLYSTVIARLYSHWKIERKHHFGHIED